MEILFACFLLILSAFFVSAGIQVLKADKVAYKSYQVLTRNITNPLFGTVSTSHDGSRDYRVDAGILWDRKNNRVIDQGKLSNESISSLFR